QDSSACEDMLTPSEMASASCHYTRLTLPWKLATRSWRTFPTPFASPPFRGQSSSRVNVLYGLCNLAVAYTLLVRVGDFEPRSAPQAGAFGLGLSAMSLLITRSLARIQREGLSP